MPPICRHNTLYAALHAATLRFLHFSIRKMLRLQCRLMLPLLPLCRATFDYYAMPPCHVVEAPY